MQAALTKNVKLLTTTPDTSSTKQPLPMPSGIKPTNSTTVSPNPQNTPNQYLPPPPTPPKVLVQQSSVKLPPLPSTKPPLPVVPPPPPPPTLPPLPPTPNQMLVSQGVAQLPPPPMPPIPPAGFPIYPYTPLQNTTQSFANSMFSQPPSLIPSVSVQYRPHETIARELGVQFMGESGSARPSYSENYNQRENASQQQSQSFSEFDIQDSYEENRQKYNEVHTFSRESAFIAGSYGNNGSQHFIDGVGSQHYSETVQHYVDSGSQHYSDTAYQSGLPFRATTLNKRGFSNRSSRPLPPPPQYHQSRQIRNHPYQRR